jgi:hypothetical protein
MSCNHAAFHFRDIQSIGGEEKLVPILPET